MKRIVNLYSFVILMLFLLISLYNIDIQAQATKTYRLTSNGSGITATEDDVVGIYVNRNIIYTGKPTYIKVNGSGTNNNISYVYFSAGFWTIHNTIQDINYWYYWTEGTQPNVFPAGALWSDGGGSVASTFPPTSIENTTANITFVDGSGFSPSNGTPNTVNNIIGRFQLTGSEIGGVLQSVTIALTGTRTNVSNVKLWSSTDAAFDSSLDTQLSSKSDAASVTFNSFNSLVSNTTGTYYFITMDLGATTGNATATIPSQASFTFTGATNPGAFSNAALSSAAVPLPVELTSFTGKANGNSITLNWETATEVNNYGFNVECRIENGEWRMLGFVQGHGNSNSPKNYSFEDKNPQAGKVQYRLKQVDFDGAFEYSPIVEVNVEAPANFALAQNFPNPFNPSTLISYQISVPSYVSLKIYDILGKEVTTLVNEFKNAGAYSAEFRVKSDEYSSGIYFYSLSANGITINKKMILTK